MSSVATDVASALQHAIKLHEMYAAYSGWFSDESCQTLMNDFELLHESFIKKMTFGLISSK